MSAKCAQNELKMSAKCAQNELEMSAKCAQNAPQNSIDKDSIDKESKGKLSQAKMTLRYFLDTHNLSSIDDRFERKLTHFFYEKNKDISDQLNYCEYVYKYINITHSIVDAKLFFYLCFRPDVLLRFFNSRNNTKSTEENSLSHWPKRCPICNEYHDLTGCDDVCPLDMSKGDFSEIELENAQKTIDKHWEFVGLNFSQFLQKSKTQGANL